MHRTAQKPPSQIYPVSIALSENMRIVLEEDCPKCGRALADEIDALSNAEYRSAAGFACPFCGTRIMYKRTRMWLLPGFLLAWLGLKMMHMTCEKYDLLCTSAQPHLLTISFACLVVLLVLFFTQCLKVKDT